MTLALPGKRWRKGEAQEFNLTHKTSSIMIKLRTLGPLSEEFYAQDNTFMKGLVHFIYCGTMR